MDLKQENEILRAALQRIVDTETHAGKICTACLSYPDRATELYAVARAVLDQGQTAGTDPRYLDLPMDAALGARSVSRKMLAGNPPAGDVELDLYCDHCGDVAITSTRGKLGVDEGGECLSCGFPGEVVIDDDGPVDDATADWLSSEDHDARCTWKLCEECRPVEPPARDVPSTEQCKSMALWLRGQADHGHDVYVKSMIWEHANWLERLAKEQSK